MRCRRIAVVLAATSFMLSQGAACTTRRPVAVTALRPGQQVRVQFSPPRPLALWPGRGETVEEIARLYGRVLAASEDSLVLRPQEARTAAGRRVAGPFREAVVLRHEPDMTVATNQPSTGRTIGAVIGPGVLAAAAFFMVFAAAVSGS